MKKTYDFLISALFVLFLTGMAAGSLILPDRSFSELENRNLRPVPELTAKRFASGRYMTEAEEYASDQIHLNIRIERFKSFDCILIYGNLRHVGIILSPESNFMRLREIKTFRHLKRFHTL